VSYALTHALGAEMRAANIEAFLYRSARTREPGTCVGLFSPAFVRKAPRRFETWSCTIDPAKAEVAKKTFGPRRPAYRYERAQFEVKGKLVVPS
jgi:hypothetical protein